VETALTAAQELSRLVDEESDRVLRWTLDMPSVLLQAPAGGWVTTGPEYTMDQKVLHEKYKVQRDCAKEAMMVVKDAYLAYNIENATPSMLYSTANRIGVQY
jgi:hypothetical protein